MNHRDIWYGTILLIDGKFTDDEWDQFAVNLQAMHKEIKDLIDEVVGGVVDPKYRQLQVIKIRDGCKVLHDALADVSLVALENCPRETS